MVVSIWIEFIRPYKKFLWHSLFLELKTNIFPVLPLVLPRLASFLELENIRVQDLQYARLPGDHLTLYSISFVEIFWFDPLKLLCCVASDWSQFWLSASVDLIRVGGQVLMKVLIRRGPWLSSTSGDTPPLSHRSRLSGADTVYQRYTEAWYVLSLHHCNAVHCPPRPHGWPDSMWVGHSCSDNDKYIPRYRV